MLAAYEDRSAGEALAVNLEVSRVRTETVPVGLDLKVGQTRGAKSAVASSTTSSDVLLARVAVAIDKHVGARTAHTAIRSAGEAPSSKKGITSTTDLPNDVKRRDAVASVVVAIENEAIITSEAAPPLGTVVAVGPCHVA